MFATLEILQYLTKEQVERYASALNNNRDHALIRQSLDERITLRDSLSVFYDIGDLVHPSPYPIGKANSEKIGTQPRELMELLEEFSDSPKKVQDMKEANPGMFNYEVVRKDIVRYKRFVCRRVLTYLATFPVVMLYDAITNCKTQREFENIPGNMAFNSLSERAKQADSFIRGYTFLRGKGLVE